VNWFDYLILFAVAVATVGVIVYLIRLKKKGKSVCGGDCSRCGANCNLREPPNKP